MRSTTKQHSRHGPTVKTLLRDERASVMVMMAIAIPVFVGFMTLAADMAYVHHMKDQLQATADAAALAATGNLPDQSACTLPTSTCYTAAWYAGSEQKSTYNMPMSSTSPVYGTVLNTANFGTCSSNPDIQVGEWNYTTSSFSCVSASPGCINTGSSPTPCNAVMVTTRRSSANGNALPLYFASYIWPSVDIAATAVAVYGSGSGTSSAGQPTWNVIIAQDISESFTALCSNGCLQNAKLADQALLQCMETNAASGSTLGITLFDGNTIDAPYQTPLAVSNSSYDTILQGEIGCTSAGSCPVPSGDGGTPTCSGTSCPGFGACGTTNTVNGDKVTMPACSGSSVVDAINSAITQFCGTGPTCVPPTELTPGSQNEIVIVTDGAPNCGSGSPPGCTDAGLEQEAITAANTAAADGISISTIFYSGDSTGSTQAANQAFLASLVRGNGVALVSPSPSQISTAMQNVCARTGLPHRLVQ